FVTTKKTILRGQLLGYHKDMGLSVEVVANELFDPDNTPITLKVADDGSFEGELPINKPQIMLILAAGSELYTFVVPGEEQEIYVDLRKKSRRHARHRADKEPNDSEFIYTSGRFSPSDIKTIFADTKNDNDYTAFLKATANMSPQTYKQYVLDDMKRELEKIPDDISPTVKRFAEVIIRGEGFVRLVFYGSIQEAAYYWATESTAPKKAGYKAPKPSLEYYSFLKDLLTDDLVFTDYYKHFVKAL
ncbi:hypothetical protein, partial [Candidatus Symbiothrix dinenymphae]|uniref:hypothetical protein n=1 Tax=Candidatus Symbiothrix dinenymphae TaxID=467085 RepID=UPI000AF1D7C0